jgi:hypothetical protein
MRLPEFCPFPYSIGEQKNAHRGAKQYVLKSNTACFQTFARSQTFVCLEANDCLAIGKHCNGASIAPQWNINRPSMEQEAPLNGAGNVPQWRNNLIYAPLLLNLRQETFPVK